jgi:2-succinyl-5-enolpyruvyl-6-hydroxy-3-cyclohexene-1-carboxylate synthase
MGKKLYPEKQHIIELVDGLYQMGLRQAVVCPGSRSAPLTLAFARHGGFQIFTVVDERSAAYMAIGQALSARGTTPVALICTSGTAVLNMGPAVAEAYYLRLPLLLLSADRPAISIDQLDGQTIRQANIFEAHTVFSGTLPEHGRTNIDLKRSRKLMQEAWSAMIRQQGPVHLNVPLHEPLYELPPFSVRLLTNQPAEQSDFFGNSLQNSLPNSLQNSSQNSTQNVLQNSSPSAASDASHDSTGLSNLRDTLRHATRILLVPGQSAPDKQLDDLVSQWLHDPRVVVLMEPVGNLLNGIHPSVTTDSSVSLHPSVSSELDSGKATACTGRVYRHEDILAQESAQVRGLRPDAIISWGLQIVSKRTRNWLRRQSETNERNPIGSRRPRHFRLDPLGWAVDPYHNPPELIRLSPYNALHSVTDVMNCERIGGQEAQGLYQHTPTAPTKSQGVPVSNESYQKQWQLQEQKAENMLIPLLKYLPFGDLAAIMEVSRHIDADDAVHLGNSMPIRYWQMLGGSVRSGWLHANRGTSGIDGVNSTALGFALSMPERIVWLVTGDLSFAYDINAFSCREHPDNLRIIVINNQGGDIFRLIDGPSRQPECEDLFATPRRIDLLALAGAWGCDTFRATTVSELNAILRQLHSRPSGRGPAVVEVVTEPKSNQIVYQSYQKALLNQ